MRLCIRLTAVGALLAVLAGGLIHLRTDTIQAGNRLHSLYGQEQALEKACSRLELSIAALKSQERMRQQAAGILQSEDLGSDRPDVAPPRTKGRNPPRAGDRSVLVDRHAHPAP